jgi:hypothetical protein
LKEPTTGVLMHDAKTDRDALIAIRDFPASANTEPDVMAQAIESMQAIAAAQLDGEDWDHLVDEQEGADEL